MPGLVPTQCTYCARHFVFFLYSLSLSNGERDILVIVYLFVGSSVQHYYQQLFIKVKYYSVLFFMFPDLFLISYTYIHTLKVWWLFLGTFCCCWKLMFSNWLFKLFSYQLPYYILSTNWKSRITKIPISKGNWN